MAQTQVQMRQIIMTQALNEAMREEIRRHERVFIMDEDIQSGIYGASSGLAVEFGKERVRDCPLAENAFFKASYDEVTGGTWTITSLGPMALTPLRRSLTPRRSASWVWAGW